MYSTKKHYYETGHYWSKFSSKYFKERKNIPKGEQLLIVADRQTKKSLNDGDYDVDYFNIAGIFIRTLLNFI